MKSYGKSYRARLVQDMRYKERQLLDRLHRIEKRGLRSPLLYEVETFKWDRERLKRANEYELEERINYLEDLGRKATSYVKGAQQFTDFVNEELGGKYDDYGDQDELIKEIINKLFETPIGAYLQYLMDKQMLSSDQLKAEVRARLDKGENTGQILTAFNEGLAKEQRGEGEFHWFSDESTTFSFVKDEDE